jgi:DNA repair exonuclease SbcCD nuclease subunit
MKIIFTSDWHLREDTPINRKDDFKITLFEKARFILQYALDNNIKSIFNAGDIFHRPRPSLELINEAIELFKEFSYVDFYLIPGNHDLVNHSLGYLKKSAIYTLSCSCSNIILVKSELDTIARVTDEISMIHSLIFEKEIKIPGIVYTTASNILEKCKTEILISGDNHQSFIYNSDDGKMLVNPGSLMRSSISEKDKEPCFYVYDTETKKINKVLIPIKKDVFKDVEKKEESDLFQSFIHKLQSEKELDLNFDLALQNFCKKQKVRSGVLGIINEVMEEVNAK